MLPLLDSVCRVCTVALWVFFFFEGHFEGADYLPLQTELPLQVARGLVLRVQPARRVIRGARAAHRVAPPVAKKNNGGENEKKNVHKQVVICNPGGTNSETGCVQEFN